jgi:hypothetical protein
VPYLVEVFLPLDRGDGSEVPTDEIEGLIAGLADRFGGATAYNRSPADGVWKPRGKTIRDRIVIVEVMVDDLDRGWWGNYRRRLEAAFEQEQMLIRAVLVERI